VSVHLADSLTVEGFEPRPWEAHDVTGRYAETFWLPIVGPSALWLLRHASLHTSGGHHPWRIHTDDLAHRLGINPTVLARTVGRLATLGMADVDGSGSVVRLATRVAWLGPRRLERLPASLRDLHASYLAHHRSDLRAYPKESA
jgi:hypothetical protein